MVQNTLARVVIGHKKFDHITPVLSELHWLPVKKRVTFKIATLTYKIHHCGQPAYLASVVANYVPARELRSSSKEKIEPVYVRTVTASRAFGPSAAAVWNGLPRDRHS